MLHIVLVHHLGYERSTSIIENRFDFRQFTPCIFANWQKFSGLSPIYPLEIRQLAKVQWAFASTSSGFSPIIRESLIGEVPDSPLTLTLI